MKYSAASVCLLFLVGQSVSGEVVSDTFDGRTLNAALWAPVFINATGTAAQTNNQLNIAAQGAADNFITGLRFRGTIAGNFDVQIGFTLNTDIDSQPRLPHDIGVGLLVGLAFVPGAYAVRGGGDGAGFVECSFEGDETRAPFSSRSGRLRIVRQGSMLSAYYWNGSSWQLIASATSIAGPAQVYIGIGGSGPVAVAASFDDFYLQADEISREVPVGSTVALPHLAAGGPWTTDLIVTNIGEQSSDMTIQFYADDGRDLILPIAGVGSVSSVSATIPAHGTAYYEATDSTGPVQGGWGSVTASAPVSVQAVFRNRASSGIHYEAAVPSNSGGLSFVMPFDATTFAPTSQPLYTGFALANLDTDTTATVTCIARDAAGTTIPNGISIPDIPARGHYANYLFPNLTGKRGTLECTSNTMITALGLRVIGTDAFSSLSVLWK